MLHFSNNYISSKVHGNLVDALGRLFGKQHVLVPVRRQSDVGVNDSGQPGVHVHYYPYPNLLRYFPLIKVLFIFLRSLSKLNSDLVEGARQSGCLAHNLWSDGVPVLLLSTVCRFRYLVVVRNTDINVFIPMLPHYRWLVRLVIKRSEGLVFVSPAHKKRFERSWPGLISSARKVEVIPNGVGEFWHRNRLTNTIRRPVSACFVGKFDENKNLRRLVQAAELCFAHDPAFQLVLVGGTESEFLKITGVRAVPDYVDIRGYLASPQALADILQRCRVFVMPSLRETFGLVFIEALSQGCTLVCSRGEGIDGFFESEFVQSVDPTSSKEIYKAVERMLSSYEEGCSIDWMHEQLDHFAWPTIAVKYNRLFS